ncbi:TPA: hypothetical protein ACH3X1_001122 [Trebouxia sp. C0004]
MADAPSGSEAEPIVVESASVGQKRKSAGHRQNDDIWQYYSQIPLPQDRAKALHRNYDACCKSCGKTVVELTDLFAEYYQADVDDPDYLVNVESLNGDIDFDHANAAAAVPANTRAMLGDNTEDFSLADMISVD